MKIPVTGIVWVGLVVVLSLMCSSVCGLLPASLPAVALGGLGLLAALLLWQHRRKLHDLLGNQMH